MANKPVRPLQEKLKAKRSKTKKSEGSKTNRSSASTTSSTPLDETDGSFVELEWERREPTRPANRQRAVLGIAIGLILAWWAALGWLVWSSLG